MVNSVVLVSGVQHSGCYTRTYVIAMTLVILFFCDRVNQLSLSLFFFLIQLILIISIIVRV